MNNYFIYNFARVKIKNSKLLKGEIYKEVKYSDIDIRNTFYDLINKIDNEKVLEIDKKHIINKDKATTIRFNIALRLSMAYAENLIQYKKNPLFYSPNTINHRRNIIEKVFDIPDSKLKIMQKAGAIYNTRKYLLTIPLILIGLAYSSIALKTSLNLIISKTDNTEQHLFSLFGNTIFITISCILLTIFK